MVQRKLLLLNLVIDITIQDSTPNGDPIWEEFDRQILTHLSAHDLVFPPNPEGDQDRDPSTLSWVLVTPSKIASAQTYTPNGKLTRNTFNLKTITKAPFGDKLPNHLSSSLNTYFLLACMCLI